MKVDDIDSRSQGEGQSAQAPAEMAPDDPTQERMPAAQSPHSLQSIEWDEVLSAAAVIVEECANEVTQAVRQRSQSLSDFELAQIEDPQAWALTLTEHLAATKLVETFDWTSLRKYVFSITGTRLVGVDDILQVTKQTVGKMTAADWRSVSNRKEYIYGIAHHRAMDWLREEKRQRGAAKRLKEATVPDHDPGDMATRVFAGRDASRLLKRIKQRRVREAFVLRKRNEWSTKEIALIMGISEDTVKEYLAKAADELSTLEGHNKGRHKSKAPLPGSLKRKED